MTQCSRTLIIYSLLWNSFEGDCNHAAEAALLELWQGSQSGTNYTIQFNSIQFNSNSCSWPWKPGGRNQALMACYRSGLTEALKDELARADPLQSLGQLSDLAITLEKCLIAHQRERTSTFWSTSLTIPRGGDHRDRQNPTSPQE